MHHDVEYKDSTFEAKQATLYEIDTKELNIQVNTSIPFTPKWKK